MPKLFIILLVTCHSFMVFSQKELTHEVYFNSDKFEIPSTEESRLLIFISNLANVDIQSISIFGFCDDIGGESYNLKLSQQRADAIKTVFSNNEISEDLIQYVDGKGKLLLKIIEKTDLNTIRAFNRKVEIKVIKKNADTIKTPTKILPIEKNTIKLISGKLKVGDKIIFKNILFESGYSEVVPKSKRTLDSIANALLARKDIYFTIQGHVCCTKFDRDAIDRKTNKQNLSQARAEYIYNYFLEKGIHKKRMRYVGLRRQFPLGGDSEFDRRVEILITYLDH